MLKKLLNGKKLLALIGAGSVILSGGIFAGIATLQGDDADSRQLKALMVESWEKEVWEAKVTPGAPEGTVEAKLVQNCVPKNLSYEKSNKQCMGVRFNFVYPGNNVVELTPKRENEKPTGQLSNDNKPIVEKFKGLPLPGRVAEISVWVLGRGNEYTLEGWVQDWRGDTHIYQFGSLDFIGWKPLSVKIPVNVPQDVDSFPQTKNLVFKKFVLRAEPKVSTEQVVLFMDSMKVLTSVYDLFFDGADVDFDEQDKKNKEAMKKIQDDYKNYTGGNSQQ